MRNKGLFPRLVLSAVLALGFLAVWMVVGIVVLENGRMIAMKNLVADTLSIRADGTALVVHSEDGVASHCDLTGVPVAIPEDDPIGSLSGVHLLPSLPWQKEDSDWDQRARFFTDGRSPRTAWYFITDGRPDGTAYFVGYDSHSKTKIGYLGLTGFRAEMPPSEERFLFAGATWGVRKGVFCPGQDSRRGRVTANRGVFSIDEPDMATPWMVYVLGLDHKIYEADLWKRTVRIAVHERDIRSFTIYDPISKDPANIAWRLAVRTDKVVLVLDNRGTEQQRYPIPEELREKPFTFGETTTGEAVMYWNKEHDIMETENVYRLFWVRPDGHTRSAALTLPDCPVMEFRFIMAALIPSPLVLDVAGVLRSRNLQEDGLTPTFGSALIRTLREFWPARVIAQLLAVGLALLCYRRQRRYGVSRMERIVWPLFVLLLGLPGWIGYRFGRSWPVLEACPDCGAAVPRDRESCLRCTNDFPRPALKGTEVFAR